MSKKLSEDPLGNDVVVVWHVTEHCNLGCHFCGYSRTLQRPRHTADPAQILALGEWLREYSLMVGRGVLVSWLGGEPLLWPPLADLTTKLKHDWRLHVSVTTNGTPLGNARLCERIIEDYDQIVVSADGLGALHDEGRAAPGLFDQLMVNVSSLRRLKERKRASVKITANTVLMHHTIRACEALWEELATWGIEEVTFNALGGRERPEFYSQHQLTPADLLWFRSELPGIRERLARRGLIIRGSDTYVEHLAAVAHGDVSTTTDCAAGRKFLSIDETGTIAPCFPTVGGYGIPMSQLRGPKDLQLLPSFFSARQVHQALAACRECRNTQRFGKFSEYLIFK